MNGRLYGNLRPGFYLLNVSCGKGLGNTREKVRFLLKLISPYMKVAKRGKVFLNGAKNFRAGRVFRPDQQKLARTRFRVLGLISNPGRVSGPKLIFLRVEKPGF